MDNCKSDAAPRQCGGWSPRRRRLNNLTISARGREHKIQTGRSFNLFVKARSYHGTNHSAAVSLTAGNRNVPVYTFPLSGGWAKRPTQIRCRETLSLLVMPVSYAHASSMLMQERRVIVYWQINCPHWHPYTLIYGCGPSPVKTIDHPEPSTLKRLKRSVSIPEFLQHPPCVCLLHGRAKPICLWMLINDAALVLGACFLDVSR